MVSTLTCRVISFRIKDDDNQAVEEFFFRVYIALSKHEGSWESWQQYGKPETHSRICITVFSDDDFIFILTFPSFRCSGPLYNDRKQSALRRTRGPLVGIHGGFLPLGRYRIQKNEQRKQVRALAYF